MVSKASDKSKFNWSCVKLISELALLHCHKKEDMELAMTMIANIANSEDEKAEEKDLFAPAK